MKTVFDHTTRAELIRRIQLLSEKNMAQWGKMNVYQMAQHCANWDEWVQGTGLRAYKQEFLGRIFGKLALKNSTKDARPIQKNMPAGRLAVKSGNGDVEQQKSRWIRSVDAYTRYSNPAFIHDFFGKMTEEQIGIFAYKHADHHLRQFGV